MPELFSLTNDSNKLLAHLQHCSAEINSAISEGYYVRMLPPAIAPIQDASGEVVDVEFCLQYEIEKLDPRKIKRVDLRDELTKHRSPDYQPPQGAG